MNTKKAIKYINDSGCLLVFPIKNAKEPFSLWSKFYPRSKMSWKWNENGDNKVFDLWALMKELSNCREVVYSKWYQGRATFFSKEIFSALLKLNEQKLQNTEYLDRTSLELLDILENDSPLSTKKLKKISDMTGKDNEKFYNRSMKKLFLDFHIVAYGEVDDGAFPSLAVGSTKLIYEDLFLQAQGMDKNNPFSILEKYFPEQSLLRKFYDKNQ